MGASLLNRDKLVNAYIGFHTTFNDALANASPLYPNAAMEVSSDNPVEEYKWLNQVPEMKRWIGDRQIEKLSAEAYQIRNEDFANGIELERDDFRDDKLGLVQLRIRQVALKGPAAIDRAVMGMLNGAFDGLFEGRTYKTYDGQYLCDTDHVAATVDDSVGNQSNKGTAALAEAAFEDAYVEMTKFKDKNGEPLDVKPGVLITGPALWKTARKIVQQTTKATGEQNLNKSLVDYVMSPRITGNKWFLVDNSQGVMPVIVQVRQAPEFRAPVTSFDDFAAFLRKTLYFGADMTFGVGLGLWQCIWGSTGAG